MQLSDFYPDMRGWTPAMENSSVAKTPQVPNDQTQVNPFLRTVLPLPLQYSGDTIKQYNRPGMSSFRTPPLPPSGIPAINSAAQTVSNSVATTIVNNIPSSDTTDIESIFTNVQTGTQYTVQLSDRVKLVSMNNNSGGTIVLPAGTLNKGTFEHVVTAADNSGTASVTGTPYFGNGSALLYAAAQSTTGVEQNPIVFTPGPWTNPASAPDVFEQLFIQSLPATPVAINPTAPISAAGPWVTALSFFQNTSAISLAQKASGGSGGLGSGTYPIAFSSNVTAKNSILVALVAFSYSSGSTIAPLVPTDTLGNTYKLIAHVIKDLGPSPAFSTQIWLYLAENIVGGANTTNLVLSGSGSLGAGIWGYELNLAGTTTSSGFDNGWYCYIENTGSGSFNVVSAANIDEVSNASIALGPNSGIIVAFDGTNWFTERGAGSGGGVTSVFGRTGAVVAATNDYTQTQIAAGAIANGTTATTQMTGDSSAQVATDAFVAAAISGVISGSTPADGMRHGNTVWWADAAYAEMRDDFFVKGGTSWPDANANGTIGELGWDLVSVSTIGSSANGFGLQGGNPPNLGIFSMANNNTRQNYGLMLLGQNNAVSTFTRNAFALLENPGWKASFVFQFQPDRSSTTALPRFNKRSMYVGLMGSGTFDVGSGTPGTQTARPTTFIGVRYDTSKVPNGMSVTSVATASGGSTVYTGSFATSLANAWKGTNVTIRGCETAANNGTFACTASTTTTLTLSNASGVSETVANGSADAAPAGINITAVAAQSGANTTYTIGDPLGLGQGSNGGYIGMTFVVTGCTNAANNGTFTCVASSNVALVLNNGAGVAETPTANAAFAAGTSLNDSTFVFECRTADLQFSGTGRRNNNQGTTFNTTVTPVIGTWYRLDLVCTTAGQVTMTLNGAHSNTFTAAQQVITNTAAWTTNAAGVLRYSSGTVTSTAAAAIPGTVGYLQTADGSSVTISGLTAPLTGLNGTFQINAQVDSGSAGNFIVIINTGQASLSASQTGTFTYYPALTPVICFGNDDSTNAGALGALNFGIDFFCLAWNKGIINPANTPTATLARYW